MKRVDFYEEVARHATILAALMRDPHPGLVSWSHGVGTEAQWLADWWEGKYADMVTESAIADK